MRDSRRHHRDPASARAPFPRAGRVGVAAIATIVTLGFGAIPSLAATSSVYYDDNQNVGAGYEFFNAGVPGAFTQNVGLGYSVMPSLTAGTANTAIGTDALHSQTAGAHNVAIGYGALFRNTTGVDNIALGTAAGYNLTTGSANILIGNNGVPGESHTIRIGNPPDYSAAYLAGIYGSTTSRGLPVVVDSSGKLGTQPLGEMLESSGLIERLRSKLGEVRARLRARVDELRTKLRAKAENARQRDQELAEQIRRLRDALPAAGYGGFGGGGFGGYYPYYDGGPVEAANP